jgi:hypothetical protein
VPVTVGLLVVLVLGMFFSVIAGHIAITKIFPKLKLLLKAIIKDEEATNSLMYIFIVYLALFVLSKLIELFRAFNVSFINDMTNIIQPGIDILMGLLPYLQWLILGILIVIGLKNFKR